MDGHSWLIIVIMLLLSAFFSGIEMAFVASNKLRIELKNKQGLLWAKILANYLKYPGRFITTVLIGNNIALVVYGILIEKQLDLLFFENQTVVKSTFELLMQTAISTVLIIVLSEYLPKVSFRANADRWLPIFIIPFQLAYYTLLPLTITLNKLADVFVKKWGGNKAEHKSELLFTKVDLDHYITESLKTEQEETPELDTEIFRNALDFDQVRVRECMVPRREVVAVELHESIDGLWKIFVESGHSRILVYKESIDNIIGYVHQVDMFKLPVSIKTVLIPVVIATESMQARELLKKFTAAGKSLAVVVDEFGGTAGIVTIEDLWEEIFGEIEDEHDVESLTEVQVNDGEFLFSARLEVDYLNEQYGLNLPEGEYETLGGFILAEYESLPELGQTVVIEPYSFKVESTHHARLGDIRVKRLSI